MRRDIWRYIHVDQRGAFCVHPLKQRQTIGLINGICSNSHSSFLCTGSWLRPAAKDCISAFCYQASSHVCAQANTPFHVLRSIIFLYLFTPITTVFFLFPAVFCRGDTRMHFEIAQVRTRYERIRQARMGKRHPASTAQKQKELPSL